MKRPLLALALLAALATAAHGFGLGLGNRFGKLGAGNGSANSGPPFTFCVDSVNGSDSNTGTCWPLSPKQNITALPTLSNGQSVGLAKGSSWRQQFTVSANNITIGSYGSGALPILDASDVITVNSGWTLVSGATHTYSRTISIVDGAEAATWLNVWETGATGDSATGQFLSFQSGYGGTGDLTNAGSYFVNQSASSNPGATATLYIRATDSTNPNSNGYLYEFASREAGLLVDGNGTTVSNIEGRKAIGNNGPFSVLGLGPYVFSGIIARDGSKHVFTAPGNTVVQNSTFINSYYSANFGGLAAIHEATGTGLGATISDNIFQQDQAVDSSNTISPIISHTNDSSSLGTITISGNWFIAKNSASLGSIGLANATDVITGNFASQVQSFATFSDNATVTNNQVVTAFAHNQILQVAAGSLTINLTGNQWCPSNTSNGVFYLDGQNNNAITSSGETYYIAAGSNNSVYTEFQNTTGGSLTFNDDVFDGAIPIQPLQLFNGTWAYTGGSISPNTFVAASANSWILNGTSFGSLAAWQGAGFDTNALTTGSGLAACTLPTIPVVN